MSTEHKQIDQIFLSVLDMSPEQRRIFLASQDLSVRHEIEALLSAYNQSNNFLESPIIPPPLLLETNLDALIGRTLGDFIIREKLGEGAFGVVYKAEQMTLMREVVLKVLHQKHRDNSEIIERFFREARLASRLEHPYTAHVYAFGAESDGLLWTAMEIVHGTPLDKLLRTQGAIELERFVPLLDKICEVVQTAHDSGIIHRDLKPANVMVISRAGRLLPKLLDFGIAKTLETDSSYITKFQIEKQNNELSEEDTSKTTGLLGSTPYMPAEQWENASQVDTRADIYALGVFAYEMLTGKRPFSGGLPPSFYNLYKEHKDSPVPSLGTNFPKALDSVIAKAMAKRPEERYNNVVDFATAFRLASGISSEQGVLPQLETQLYEKLLANAPQPLAESVARFSSARNLHQSRERMLSISRVIVRYLGLIALASRAQIGAGQKRDNEQVKAFIQKIRSQELNDKEWLELTQELCKPFALKRDVYPIPELISFLFQPSSNKETDKYKNIESLLELESISLLGATEEQVQNDIVNYLPKLTNLLYEVSFLLDYTLVAKQSNAVEKWMGIELGTLQVSLPKLQKHHVAVLDSNFRLVLSLWPILQIAEPIPGTREELFFLTGKGRHGAKLISLPSGFEKQDDAVWKWLETNFFESTEEHSYRTEEQKPPYLGLTAFTSADADLFFGRERDTEAFLNRLKIQSLLAIVGTSGAGKSSFLQAGIFPGLPNNWRTITIRPGATPIATLVAKLKKEFGNFSEDLKDLFSKDQSFFGKYLHSLAEKNNITIIFCVDQFEELFTLCPDPNERQLYASMLTQAAQSPEDPIRVVLVLRDDFLVRAKQLPALKERLTQGLEVLTTPASEDLLKILLTPAEKVGYQFEDPALPKEIVESVIDQAGALPLLAFTAAKLWELRDRNFKQLLRKTYVGMGGVGGALAQHAEAMLEAMSNSEQRLVKEAFRQLVTSEGTRAILTRTELIHLLGNSQDANIAIEKLIVARLLVASEGEFGLERVEIVHEALLLAWPRLVQWQQEEKENTRLRDQLRIAAKQWHERGQVKGLLWRDEALTEYQLWRTRYNGKLTEIEEAFALASLSEAKRGQRRTRLLVSGILLGLTVGLIILFQQHQLTQEAAKTAEETAKKLSFEKQNVEKGAQEIKVEKQRADEQRQLAEEQSQLADQQRQLAEANEIEAEKQTELAKNKTEQSQRQLLELYEERGRQELLLGNPINASLYLSEAYRLGKTTPSLKYLLADSMRALDSQLISLDQHKERVYIAEFSPDGTKVLTADDDGTGNNNAQARIWQASNGVYLTTLEGYKGGEPSAHFSSNGSLVILAGSSDCNCAQVFNTTDGKLLYLLEKHSSKVISANFSKTGQVLSASRDGNINLWDLASGKFLFSLKRKTEGKRTSFLYLADFNPQGTKIVSIDGEGIKIWGIKEKSLLNAIEYEKKINSISFSLDGLRMITASEDNTAKIWDIETGRLLTSLEGHKSNIYWAEFNPTGNKIVTASADGTAKIWDSSTGKLLTSLEGHLEIVNTAHFTPDGTRVITTSSDFTAKIWDSNSGLPLATLQSHKGNVYSASLNYNGKKVITASNDGTAKIWDTTHDKLQLSYDANQNQTAFGLFTKKEPRIITAGNDDRIKIWDATTSKMLIELGLPVIGITQTEFHPGGKKLVTVGDNDLVKVWDTATGKVLFNFDGYIATFSPDGNYLVTITRDKKITIWNSETGKLIKTFQTNSSVSKSIKFSPDNNYLLTTNIIDKKRVAQIWQISTGNVISSFSDKQGKITYAEFNSDGTKIVTASEDNRATIWDTKTGKLLLFLEGHRGTIYSVHFSPDNTKLITTSNDKSIRLWDSSTGRMLASIEGHNASVYSAYFSDDGQQIITTSKDKIVKVWDISSETRSPQEISKLVTQLVPFYLDEGQLIPTKPLSNQSLTKHKKAKHG